MVNKRFLQTAERWKNPSLPDAKTRTKKETRSDSQKSSSGIIFPDGVSDSFILSYDGKYKDFAQEAIVKNNELFGGTKAEIPFGAKGEIKNMHALKRFGLITTIYNTPQLRKENLWPITPAQSEVLLRDGKLTNPEDNWEDLALLLYDRNGENPREAQALYDALKNHRQDLGLSTSDLEKRLVIVNAGIERDGGSDYGVKPVVLPGLTQVYTHEVLSKVGEDLNFQGYGTNGGFPLLNQLDSGDRGLYMPDETENIGLRVLCRYWDLDLFAWNWDLASSNENGRVNFAPQGRAP